jgi:hypothetical protein
VLCWKFWVLLQFKAKILVNWFIKLVNLSLFHVSALEKQSELAGIKIGLSHSPKVTKYSLFYIATRSLDLVGLHTQFLFF